MQALPDVQDRRQANTAAIAQVRMHVTTVVAPHVFVASSSDINNPVVLHRLVMYCVSSTEQGMQHSCSSLCNTG
jgi:hypothetical protein